MMSSRHLLTEGLVTDSERTDRLSSAWTAIVEGRGSKDDAELVFADLALYTGFYNVTGENTEPHKQMRAEGRRDVMARIVYLIDQPFSFIKDLRRAALDELQIAQSGAFGE